MPVVQIVVAVVVVDGTATRIALFVVQIGQRVDRSEQSVQPMLLQPASLKCCARRVAL